VDKLYLVKEERIKFLEKEYEFRLITISFKSVSKEDVDVK